MNASPSNPAPEQPAAPLSSQPVALQAFRAEAPGGSPPEAASAVPTAAPAASTSALPEAALAALDEARDYVRAWGEEQVRARMALHVEAESLRAQLDHMHAELGIAHEDIARLQRDHAEFVRLRDHAYAERDQALQEYAQARQREEAALHAAQQAREQLALLAQAHQQAQEAHQAAVHAHRAEQAAHRETQAAHEQARQAHEQAVQAHRAEKAARADERAQVEQQQRAREQEAAARDEERRREHDKLQFLFERNKDLRERLLEVYGQLDARDLPSLILQVCVNLTRSESGLFVEADGDDTLAQVRFEELPDFIREELYGWTRRVASEQEPVHENDPSNLPDGSALVNLAALPVSMHSQLKGVILVANKRGEDGQPEGYTEEDTELLVAIGRHAGLAMENRRLHTELGTAFQSTVAVLADAIEAKDAYTRGHCQSVSDLAVRVAEKLGFEGEALKQIRYAALLHDVGKIGVPDGILLKPGRLLPEEFSIIQRHSQIGRDLIARVPLLAHIAPVVMHHHERIDGTGYPGGLSGDGISMASRIICVADAFDAMTTPRPYREPVAAAEALAELRRCAGTHFDAIVVEKTVEVLAEMTG